MQKRDIGKLFSDDFIIITRPITIAAQEVVPAIW